MFLIFFINFKAFYKTSKNFDFYRFLLYNSMSSFENVCNSVFWHYCVFKNFKHTLNIFWYTSYLDIELVFCLLVGSRLRYNSKQEQLFTFVELQLNKGNYFSISFEFKEFKISIAFFILAKSNQSFNCEMARIAYNLFYQIA